MDVPPFGLVVLRSHDSTRARSAVSYGVALTGEASCGLEAVKGTRRLIVFAVAGWKSLTNGYRESLRSSSEGGAKGCWGKKQSELK